MALRKNELRKSQSRPLVAVFIFPALRHRGDCNVGFLPHIAGTYPTDPR